MIEFIVVSKDRAMQLDLMLRSLYNKVAIKDFVINVIYNAKNESHNTGYDILKDKYPKVNFIKEEKSKIKFSYFPRYWRNTYWYLKYKYYKRDVTNFRDLLQITIYKSTARYVMFLVDDIIFTGNIKFDEWIFQAIEKDKYNSTYSIVHNVNSDNVPKKLSKIGKYYQWDYYNELSEKEWAYPFNICGKLFHIEFLKRTIPNIMYTNPPDFESNVCAYVKEKKFLKTGYCSSKSLIVSFLINQVQSYYKNNNLNVSLDFLNDKFISGYNIKEFIYLNDNKSLEIYPEKIIFEKAGLTETVKI